MNAVFHVGPCQVYTKVDAEPDYTYLCDARDATLALQETRATRVVDGATQDFAPLRRSAFLSCILDYYDPDMYTRLLGVTAVGEGTNEIVFAIEPQHQTPTVAMLLIPLHMGPAVEIPKVRLHTDLELAYREGENPPQLQGTVLADTAGKLFYLRYPKTQKRWSLSMKEV